MIHQSPKLYTSKEVDQARKEGWELCEGLYMNVIKQIKKEIKEKKNGS